MLVSRSWCASALAAVSVAATGGGIYCDSGRAATRPPTIAVIARNFANALSKAETTRFILRVHKHRTNTPGFVTAVEWVDLVSGQSHIRWYDASGHLHADTSRRYSGKMVCGTVISVRTCTLPASLSEACGCDLDPFTNFPPSEPPRISLLGQETFEGKQTYHLRFVVTGLLAYTTDLWIDRSTYLPVHEELVQPGPHTNLPGHAVTNDFTWFPRTSAALAQLGNG